MRSIHGQTKLLGLLGHDTPYTLSPAMHNAAAAKLNLDCVYVNFDLAAEHVGAFLDLFWHLGGVGLNITKPHKSMVAQLIGTPLRSVNTLTRGESCWVGRSTDGAGFASGLGRIDIAAQDVHTLICMGSGGAAQAIAEHFATHHAETLKQVVLVRRSDRNDRIFAKMLAAKNISLKLLPWAPESLTAAVAQISTHEHTLCVQASSAPQQGDDLKEWCPAFQTYTGNFVDLIYDKPSALYYDALQRNLKAQDGLPMLIEQARLSQKIWWGKAAPYEDLWQSLKNTGRF